MRHLDPASYPRDAVIIDSQARLTVVDEAIAWLVRLTGVSLQRLFLVLYVGTLLLLAAAAARIGARFYRHKWTVAALLAALTLRHAIAKTGANTLEGYFHPRQLAFALGLWGVAMFLERRHAMWIALLVLAAAVHPTTAIWFAIWLGVAAFAARPEWRRPLAAAAVSGIAILALLVWRGSLAPHLAIMDAEWLAAIGEKDLFPLSWPIDVWITNLVAVPIILLCWRARARQGITIIGETPLVIGSMALVALFAAWLPFNVAHVALAVQMQAARVFWLVDVFGTFYLIWWFAEARATRRPAVVAAVVILFSLARGLYTSLVQFPERRLFAVDIQHDDWREAMRFVAASETDSGWLADPAHAAKYGSSLRAAGRRDVLIEALKDRAIAMYDRDIARRIADREQALQALQWNTPDGARGLARRFGLDYLVVDRELDLPLVHRAGSLFIYRIR